MAAVPEEPKKPQNAYWIWLGENREALTKEVGSAKLPVVAKLAGEKWKAMSAEARKPFEDRAAKLKAEYDTAMEEFKAGGGQVGKRRVEKKEAKDAKAGKKAKKEARKASGQPERPASAYQLWLGENREALTKEVGSAKLPVVAKLASEKWKAMSAEARKPFEDQAAKRKAEYDTAMEEFKAGGGQVVKRRVRVEKKLANVVKALKKARKEAKDAKAGKKAKKEARKASGKPERPASAYQLWLGENREALTKEVGSAKLPVVAKLAGERWKALPAEAKEPFEAKAAELKAAYAEARQAETPPAKRPRTAAPGEGDSTKKVPATQGRNTRKALAAAATAVLLEKDIADEAEKAGLAAVLQKLLAREDVAASGKSQAEVFRALQGANGLVHPARRALLGA